MSINTDKLVRNLRRVGPPAALAACLAIGPAFAQSTTVTTTEPSVERTETKIKEKKNGDVVVKQKSHDDGDTVKSKTTIRDDEPSTTTTTTVR